MAKTMTPSEAIIVLDRLNTEERISVDRDELRAAVVVAKATILKQVKRKLVGNEEGGLECSVCGTTIDVCPSIEHFCYNCGQALDWSDEENA